MDFDNNAVITPREVSAYLQSRVDEANEDPNADKVYSIKVWAKDMEYPLFVMNP